MWLSKNHEMNSNDIILLYSQISVMSSHHDRGFPWQQMCTDTETYSQTLHRKSLNRACPSGPSPWRLGNLEEKWEERLQKSERMEDRRKTQPTESTKQGSHCLPDTEAASRVYRGLHNVLCIYECKLAVFLELLTVERMFLCFLKIFLLILGSFTSSTPTVLISQSFHVYPLSL